MQGFGSLSVVCCNRSTDFAENRPEQDSCPVYEYEGTENETSSHFMAKDFVWLTAFFLSDSLNAFS